MPELPPDSRHPDINLEDALNLKYSKPIARGTNEFANLVDIDYGKKALPILGIRLNELRQVFASSALVTSNPQLEIRIAKAWSPMIPSGSTSDLALSLGLTATIEVFDTVSGQRRPDLLSKLSGMATKIFHYVRHIVSAPNACLAVSMGMPGKMGTIGFVTPDRVFAEKSDLESKATEVWKNTLDYSDLDELTSIAKRFPETLVELSAVSLCYQITRAVGEPILARSSLLPVDEIETWTSEYANAIRFYHRFLNDFPRFSSTEVVRLELLALVRKLDQNIRNSVFENLSQIDAEIDAAPTTFNEKHALFSRYVDVNQIRGVVNEYHEIASRYAGTAEATLALHCLYALEFDNVARINSLESFLSFMRDYPDAPQWDECAKRASKIAIYEENEFADRLTTSQKTERKAILEDQFERTILALEKEMVSVPSAGTARTAPNTANYKDVEKARYLVAAINRAMAVAGGGASRASPYPGLLATLGTRAAIWRISERITDLSQFVGAKIDEATRLTIEQVKLNRDELRGAIGTILSAHTSLLSTLDDRFDKVEEALADLHSDVSQIELKINVVIQNQAKLSQKLDEVDEKVSSVLDSVDQIKSNLDHARGTSAGFLGGILNNAKPRGIFKTALSYKRKLVKSTWAEVSRVHMPNIHRALENPTEFAHKRFTQAKNNLAVESKRGISAVKSTWWYRQLSARGLDLVMQPPDSKFLIEISPTVDRYPGKEVYFVNGLNNTESESLDHGRFLAEHLSMKVKVLYNPTNFGPPWSTTDQTVETSYGTNDIAEAIYDRLWPASVLAAPIAIGKKFLGMSRNIQENPTTRMLAHEIYHHANDGKEMRIVCHSQGTLIGRNALLISEILRKDLAQTYCVFAGCALNKIEMPSSRKVGNISWLLNDQDFVAATIGLSSSKWAQGRVKLDRNEHNFSNEAAPNGGVTPSGKKTYVRMIDIAYLNADSSGTTGRTIRSEA